MLALQKRLHVAFAQSLGLVLLIGGFSFYYLNKLDHQLRDQIDRNVAAIKGSEFCRDSFNELTTISKRDYENDSSHRQAFEGKLISFEDVVNEAKHAAFSPKNIERYTRMEESIDTYQGLSAAYEGADAVIFFKDQSPQLMRELQASIGSIFEGRYAEFSRQEKELENLLEHAKRNILLLLLLVVGGGAALAFLTPVRVVWPFKKLFAAFQEALEGNLSVRLPISGEGESSEMAHGFNALMTHIENIDDMKTRKIRFMHRRFETLANVMDAAVMLVSVEGEVLFLNAPAYRAFELTSDEVKGKSFEKMNLPIEMRDLLSQVIENKDRIEDKEWSFCPADDGKPCKVTLDVFPISRHSGEIVNILIVLEERRISADKRFFHRWIGG